MALEVVAPNFAVLAGTLAFYPGLAPQRAIIAELSAPAVPLDKLPEPKSFHEQLKGFRQAAAANPWLDEYPVRVDAALVHGPKWELVTADNSVLPVAAPEDVMWRLAGYSAGQLMRVCGIWDGEHLTPLSADGHGNLLDVSAGDRT